jgi:hypothetical protein
MRLEVLSLRRSAAGRRFGNVDGRPTVVGIVVTQLVVPHRVWSDQSTYTPIHRGRPRQGEPCSTAMPGRWTSRPHSTNPVSTTSRWAQPGASIEQLTGKIEMPHVAGCLLDHVQHDVADGPHFPRQFLRSFGWRLGKVESGTGRRSRSRLRDLSVKQSSCSSQRRIDELWPTEEP